jgi:hypothetical protein
MKGQVRSAQARIQTDKRMKVGRTDRHNNAGLCGGGDGHEHRHCPKALVRDGLHRGGLHFGVDLRRVTHGVHTARRRRERQVRQLIQRAQRLAVLSSHHTHREDEVRVRATEKVRRSEQMRHTSVASPPREVDAFSAIVTSTLRCSATVLQQHHGQACVTPRKLR